MEKLTNNNKKFVSQIQEHLFLGSWLATKPVILKTLDITNVISIGCDPYSKHIPGVNYKFVYLEDNIQSANTLFDILPEIVPYMRECIEKDLNVLIHCSAGKSRSASIVIAYLTKYNDMNLNEALTFVQSKRKCINPNEGFMSILNKTIK